MNSILSRCRLKMTILLQKWKWICTLNPFWRQRSTNRAVDCGKAPPSLCSLWPWSFRSDNSTWVPSADSALTNRYFLYRWSSEIEPRWQEDPTLRLVSDMPHQKTLHGTPRPFHYEALMETVYHQAVIIHPSVSFSFPTSSFCFQTRCYGQPGDGLPPLLVT